MTAAIVLPGIDRRHSIDCSIHRGDLGRSASPAAPLSPHSRGDVDDCSIAAARLLARQCKPARSRRRARGDTARQECHHLRDRAELDRLADKHGVSHTVIAKAAGRYVDDLLGDVFIELEEALVRERDAVG